MSKRPRKKPARRPEPVIASHGSPRFWRVRKIYGIAAAAFGVISGVIGIVQFWSPDSTISSPSAPNAPDLRAALDREEEVSRELLSRLAEIKVQSQRTSDEVARLRKELRDRNEYVSVRAGSESGQSSRDEASRTLEGLARKADDLAAQERYLTERKLEISKKIGQLLFSSLFHETAQDNTSSISDLEAEDKRIDVVLTYLQSERRIVESQLAELRGAAIFGVMGHGS